MTNDFTREGHRFLFSLSDVLLRTSSAREIMNLAVERLAQHLGAQRAGYGEIQPDGETVVLSSCFADGVQPLVGVFSLNSFGAASIELQRRGQTQACDDVAADPDQDQAVWEAIATRSFISVPLIRDGNFVASLYVNFSHPHRWTQAEIAIVEDVAARTWAAVERARAEEALRDSEERLRLATDHAEVGFWDVDVVNDVLIWPPRVKAMFGISSEVPVTMNDFYEGLHPDDRAATTDAFALAADPDIRGLYDVEYRTIGKEDGLVRWIAAKGRGVFDDAGRCLRVVGTAIDISTRKELAARRLALVEFGAHIRELADPTEIAFQASAILARTLGVSRGGYGVINARDETITIERDWNAPGIQSLAGVLQFRDYGSYVEDLIAGRTVAIADVRLDPRTADLAGELEAISARSFVNMPVTEQGDSVALLYLNYEGAREWSEEELSFIREVAERTRTATARLTAERELREGRDRLEEERRSLEILNRTGAQVASELNLEALVQTVVAAGVALTRAQFGAFFYNVLNDQGESYMLYALAGAERNAFDGFGMPRATSVFAPTFRGEGVIRSDDILKDVRYGKNHPHKGMPEGHLPVRSYLAVPVTSRSGEVIGGLFFGHEEPGRFDERAELVVSGLAGQAAIGIDNARLFDAAQRANAELEDRVRERTLELEQAHEALRQSQKMEAVGQLTGGIAHDFNNLLAGISGSLEVVERRLEQGRLEGIVKFISGAQTSAQRAAALTQRLLAFSRRQTLDPKTTDVNRLVLGMEDLIRRTVGPAIAVEVVGAAGLWTTKVDQAQLESALLNLAINARDAMPEGGRITIETANKWLDDRASTERELSPGQYISVCVTDSGTGIPKDIVDRIFDPFFTTKPIGQGTGLGLSMIHGFIRQSGGQIRVYTEEGHGTTMCLYLPRHLGALNAEQTEGSGTIPEFGSGEVVLVIDDEPTVRVLIVEVLSEAGYTAIEAEDGPSGLKILNSQVHIDLLITDVGLPGGMNGRQVADAARSSRPDLKVLFVTGFAENAAVGNGHLEAGMEVITKPFAMADLANKITQMIEGRPVASD